MHSILIFFPLNFTVNKYTLSDYQTTIKVFLRNIKMKILTLPPNEYPHTHTRALLVPQKYTAAINQNSPPSWRRLSRLLVQNLIHAFGAHQRVIFIHKPISEDGTADEQQIALPFFSLHAGEYARLFLLLACEESALYACTRTKWMMGRGSDWEVRLSDYPCISASALIRLLQIDEEWIWLTFSIGRLNFGLWWFLVTMEPGGI